MQRKPEYFLYTRFSHRGNAIMCNYTNPIVNGAFDGVKRHLTKSYYSCEQSDRKGTD